LYVTFPSLTYDMLTSVISSSPRPDGLRGFILSNTVLS
jgi:hypothetical protein